MSSKSKLKKKSTVKLARNSKPVEKFDIQTTVVGTKGASASVPSNSIDDLLSSITSKYKYGYIAPPEEEPKPKKEESSFDVSKLKSVDGGVSSAGKKRKLAGSSESTSVDGASAKKKKGVAAVKGSKSAGANTSDKVVASKKKKTVVDDNSDWSDSFEEEEVDAVAPVTVTKTGKKAATATPTPSSAGKKKATTTTVASKKTTAPVTEVVDDNSDWSDSFEEEEVDSVAAPIKAKKTTSKLSSKKTAEVAVVAEKKTKKTATTTTTAATTSKSKAKKSGGSMDMFMSLEDMEHMTYDENEVFSDREDGEDGMDDFMSNMFDGTDSENENDGASDVKSSASSTKSKSKSKVAAVVASKTSTKQAKSVSASSSTTATTKGSTVKGSKTSKRVPLPVEESSSSEEEEEVEEEDIEEDIEEDEIEEDDDDVEIEDDDDDGEYNFADYDKPIKSRTPTSVYNATSNYANKHADDNDNEEEEDDDDEDNETTANDDDDSVIPEYKYTSYLLTTPIEAIETCLHVATPKLCTLDHFSELCKVSEVGRSGILTILHDPTMYNPLSRNLLISELFRLNLIKDIYKTFGMLTQEYLKDNEYNNFEIWLLKARFNSLLVQPLPTSKLIPTNVRRLIIQKLQEKDAKLSKITYTSPISNMSGVIDEDQRHVLEEKKKLNLLRGDARDIVKKKLATMTEKDSLLPYGSCITENMEFAELLLARKAKPETIVNICKLLNQKIETGLPNIKDGGVYKTFNGNVQITETICVNTSKTANIEEIAWGLPVLTRRILHSKVTLAAGKVQYTISSVHYVKLLILYYASIARSKHTKIHYNVGFDEVHAPAYTSTTGTSNDDKKTMYTLISHELHRILHTLPSDSCVRLIIGTLLRNGTVDIHDIYPEYSETMKVIQRQSMLHDKLGSMQVQTQTDDDASDDDSTSTSVVDVVPAPKDLENYKLSGKPLDASISASSNIKDKVYTMEIPKPTANALFTLLTRYHSIQGGVKKGGGNQASIPYTVFQTLQKDFDTSVECFASPLNCYFGQYCSAFPDTDAFFGSLGSFFQFTPATGSYQVNPPFDKDIILATSIHIEQLLAKQKTSQDPLMFVVIIPEQKEQLGWKHLDTSDFCSASITVAARQHAYYEGLQQVTKLSNLYHTSRHDTSVFIMQNDAAARKWPATEAKLARLVASFQTQFVVPQQVE